MKKKVAIGLAVILLVILGGTIIINNKKGSPEKTIDKYCKILVDGNYGDIIGIVHFPESNLITDKKIEELKSNYYDKMAKEYDDVVNCTYTQANETEDTITYKVIVETSGGEDTEKIEVGKKDNKIILEDIYAERHIEVYEGAKVYIDGVELNDKPESQVDEDNHVDIYKVVVLPDVDYDIKVTHSMFEDGEVILNGETVKYIKHPIFEGDKRSYDRNTIDFTNGGVDALKKKYRDELEKDICEGCKEIVTVSLEKGDISQLNQYFKNNNAEEFISDNSDLNGTREAELEKVYGVKTYDVEFKDITRTHIDTLKYTNENELTIRVRVTYRYDMSYENGNIIIIDGDGSGSFVHEYDTKLDLHCIKDGDSWKINTWD